MNPRPRRRRRRMLNWILFLVAVPLMIWAFFRWFERSNVYHPSRTWWSSGADLGGPWEDVWLRAADGTELSAWFFPAPANARFHHLAVVINHGNGGNISHRLPLYRVFLTAGVNVLAYDYRGYGRSGGRPTESGTYADGEAALDWLKARGFSEDRILVHGESLGGGIAAELALRRPRLRGLILQSTFTSIPDLGCELFPLLPVRTMSTIAYDTRSKLPRIRVPVLVLHSRADTLVRFAHAEANLAAANEPKALREILGDHNEQPDASPEAFVEALREFLRTPGAPASAPPP